MKILYTTDLHGCRWKYERLLNLAHRHAAEVVINGGDMLPKGADLLWSQHEFIGEFLQAHFESFQKDGIRYLCCLGNDDLARNDGAFEAACQKTNAVTNVAGKKILVQGYEFIGMNLVVDYPFRLKDRCRMDTRDFRFPEQYGSALFSEKDGMREVANWQACAKTLPTIQEELDMLPRPSKMDEAVYIMHMPPAFLGLDVCGNGQCVGSVAVYQFLRDNQPLLSLHGHIHESPDMSGIWQARLKQTICIQPGQSGALTYVVIDLESLESQRYLET